MRTFLMFLGAAALAAGSAAGQTTRQTPPASSPAPSAEFWAVSDSQIAVVPARIAFPRTAGTVSAYQNGEFSQQGQGLDLAIQYRSPDQAIFATVYVYYPSLAHTGLSAFSTDEGINVSSGSPVTRSETRVTAAGGREGVAVRRDYSGYRGNLASTAAFIKTDRWMIKLRVSGPETRRSEVMEAMDRLLAGIRFGRQFRPRPAALLEVTECAAGGAARAARELPDPTGPESAAHAFLATFDGGGVAATAENGERNDLPSRVPAAMCLSQRAHIGRNTIPILRGPEGPPLSVDGRTMLIAVISDAGDMFEVVHAPNLQRYWLIRHRLGEALFVRSYDGVPSDEQVLAAISENMSGQRPVNIRVRLTPDGGTQIFIPGGEAPSPPRTGG